MTVNPQPSFSILCSQILPLPLASTATPTVTHCYYTYSMYPTIYTLLSTPTACTPPSMPCCLYLQPVPYHLCPAVYTSLYPTIYILLSIPTACPPPMGYHLPPVIYTYCLYPTIYTPLPAPYLYPIIYTYCLHTTVCTLSSTP